MRASYKSALEYTEWRNFSKVIERAKNSCQNSGNPISDHFVEVNKIVKAGATTKDIGDIELSLLCLLLIVQNGDSLQKDDCSWPDLFCS